MSFNSQGDSFNYSLEPAFFYSQVNSGGRLVRPQIVDLDGDGINELLHLSSTGILKVCQINQF